MQTKIISIEGASRVTYESEGALYVMRMTMAMLKEANTGMKGNRKKTVSMECYRKATEHFHRRAASEITSELKEWETYRFQ